MFGVPLYICILSLWRSILKYISPLEGSKEMAEAIVSFAVESVGKNGFDH